jgi:alpha-galactosidase
VRTHLSLWAIFRSPLMMGGDLPSLDAFTLSLLTNDEVLAVDQHSTGNQEILRPGGNEIIWKADTMNARGEYVALFNLGEEAQTVVVSWKELGVRGKEAVRDLWQKKDLGAFEGQFAARINPHGAGLYKVTPVE